MTIVTGAAGGDTGNAIGVGLLEGLLNGTLTTSTSTNFVISGVTGYGTLTFTGTDFTYSQGAPNGGTITSMSQTLPNSQQGETWTGLSVSLASFWNDMIAAESTGDLTAVNNLFFGGNDTFNAQGPGAQFAGFGGDDVFNMGQYFSASTVTNGGPGRNTLVLDGDYVNGGDTSNAYGVNAQLISYSANQLTDIQKITLTGAHHYAFDWNWNATSDVSTVTIDASGVTAGGSVFFDAWDDDGSYDTTIVNFVMLGSAKGNDTLVGGWGNNTITETAGNNTIDIPGSGVDIVKGGSGNDTIIFHAPLNATDSIDGGGGVNELQLNGDYSAGFTLAPSMTKNIQTLDLPGGTFTAAAGLAAPGQTLTVEASEGSGGFNFDGSAETGGKFDIVATSGTLIGGQGGDTFDLSNDGGIPTNAFTVKGGAGDDTIICGDALRADGSLQFQNISIDGGGGFNTVILSGDYESGVTFLPTTLVNVQKIVLDKTVGFTGFDITTNDATVAAGQTLIVDASALDLPSPDNGTLENSLNFYGSAETNGNFDIIGGAGDDTLIGGTGNDVFTPGSGSDKLNGGGGWNTVDYSGNFSSYTITNIGDGSVRVIKPGGGNDTLTHIQHLVFSDQTVAISTVAANDFNADMNSDILWQNTNGQAAIWTMNGFSQLGGSTVGGNPGSNWKVVGSADFNGDGHADILWQNSSNGQVVVWTMNGLDETGSNFIGGAPGAAWKVVATGDFAGNGQADLVFQNAGGQAVIWTMNGTAQTASTFVGGDPGSQWHIVGTGDFNADGKSDLVWQDSDNGQVVVWTMNGTTQTGSYFVGGAPGADWKVVSVGDFAGNGQEDLLFQNSTTGQPVLWTMNGTTQTASTFVGGNPGPTWHIEGVGDYNGDGKADILWQNTNGQAAIWTMNGATQLGGSPVGGNPGTSWHIPTGVG